MSFGGDAGRSWGGGGQSVEETQESRSWKSAHLQLREVGVGVGTEGWGGGGGAGARAEDTGHTRLPRINSVVNTGGHGSRSVGISVSTGGATAAAAAAANNDEWPFVDRDELLGSLTSSDKMELPALLHTHGPKTPVIFGL